MKDFPPRVTAFEGSGDNEPDTHSAWRYLRWVLRDQWGLVVLASAFSMLWILPSALTPWIVGHAIDDGIAGGETTALVGWVGLLLAITMVAAITGAMGHTIVVRAWLVALYGTALLVARKGLQLGHVLPRRTPTGEVLSVAESDGNQFGAFVEITARVIGNLFAYAIVAAIVLSTSLRLGLIMLLVTPLLVITTAPLMRPLTRAQGKERSRDSELTSQATDIVAGLRVLRGIGGETTFGDNYARQSQRVRVAGVRAGVWAGLVDAIGVLLSGLFLVALMVQGVEELRAERIEIGELIAFLGYALFLVQPIRTFFEFAQKVTKSLVAARKSVGVLGQPNPWPQIEQSPPLQGDLVDERSGLRARDGVLTMVVSADPSATAALADRLGRYLPRGTDAPSMKVDDLSGAAAKKARREAEQQRAEIIKRDLEFAGAPAEVTLGDVDLSHVPIDTLRDHILVGDTEPFLFAGTLQEAIDPQGVCTRAQAEEAMQSAGAHDVYEAVPGGWAGILDERGRGLSGGQRQRLALARALASNPPVLILVEPTSAVDAHTEALIASRLPASRAGQTTVVMTTSPLLLHHAEDVVLLRDGRVVGQGSHDELVAASPEYRAVVLREESHVE